MTTDDTSPSPSAPLPVPFAERFLKTIALWMALVPLALACLTVTRLYRMMGYDLDRTTDALQVVDQTPLLLSTLLSSAPFVALAVIAVSTASVTRRRLSRRRGADRPSTVLGVDHRTWAALAAFGVSSVVLASVLPVRSLTIILSIASAAIALTAVGALLQRHATSEPRRVRTAAAVSRWILAVPVMATGLLFVYGSLFAVPLRTGEQITMSSTVYSDVWVMGEQGGRTLLMNDQQESRWISTDAITSRRFCKETPAASRSRIEPAVRLLGPPRQRTNLKDDAPCAP